MRNDRRPQQSTPEQKQNAARSDKARRQWLKVNANAIEHYNKRIERIGEFSMGLRRF